MIGVLAWALDRKLFDLYVSHLKKDREIKPPNGLGFIIIMEYWFVAAENQVIRLL
jgi:hypothetical protein